MIFLACAIWALPAWLAGTAFGPYWLEALGRRYRRRRGRAGYRPRHTDPPLPPRTPIAEPELTGWQRQELAGIIAWAEQYATPAAIANGRGLADLIRYDELGTDLAVAGVLLHIVSYTDGVQKLPEADSIDPAELGEMIGDAIAAAVYELTSLHRQTV